MIRVDNDILSFKKFIIANTYYGKPQLRVVY